jgi:hypothetical protein
VLVLTLDGDAIADVRGFLDPALLPWFGLPLTATPETAPIR